MIVFQNLPTSEMVGIQWREAGVSIDPCVFLSILLVVSLPSLQLSVTDRFPRNLSIIQQIDYLFNRLNFPRSQNQISLETPSHRDKEIIMGRIC